MTIEWEKLPEYKGNVNLHPSARIHDYAGMSDKTMESYKIDNAGGWLWSVYFGGEFIGTGLTIEQAKAIAEEKDSRVWGGRVRKKWRPAGALSKKKAWGKS